MNLPERKTIAIALASTLTFDILRRYSSFKRLCRVVAYVRRFCFAFKKNKRSGPLEVEEINEAERTVIRWVQQEEFSQELRCLKQNRELPRKSSLMSLRPFRDEEGLIRVGGRF